MSTCVVLELSSMLVVFPTAPWQERGAFAACPVAPPRGAPGSAEGRPGAIGLSLSLEQRPVRGLPGPPAPPPSSPCLVGKILGWCGFLLLLRVPVIPRGSTNGRSRVASGVAEFVSEDLCPRSARNLLAVAGTAVLTLLFQNALATMWWRSRARIIRFSLFV